VIFSKLFVVSKRKYKTQRPLSWSAKEKVNVQGYLKVLFNNLHFAIKRALASHGSKSAFS
jgi:hypothetical protein